MKLLKIGSLIITFLFFGIGNISAQIHGSLSLLGGFPQQDFQEATDAVGIGGNLNFYFPMGEESLVFVGLDLGFLNYGNNARNEELVANITIGNHSV